MICAISKQSDEIFGIASNLRQLLLVYCFILNGCSDKPTSVEHRDSYSVSGQHEVYVVNHGWHTGFVIPTDMIFQSIPDLRQRFAESTQIEIGWGDRKFYQAKQVTSGLALRAILWPTDTVIHAVAVPQNVMLFYSKSNMEMLCLTEHELSDLVAFISKSFYKNELGEVEALDSGLYGDSQFYKGAGDYHIMNTCNKWTAKGLKSIGMEITPALKLTAESVMNAIRSVNSTSTKAAKPDQSLRCSPTTDSLSMDGKPIQ
jgi:uncharacterized protein (TIGR02117 family)